MNIGEDLRARLGRRVVVVGIGNRLRGDDAVGSLVAERLRPTARLMVIDAEDAPERFLGAIAAARPDSVVLVDALLLGAAAGAVALLRGAEIAGCTALAHRIPVALLAGILHVDTGAEVLVLGIQPARLGFGRPLSEPVAASAALVAELLQQATAAPALLEDETPRAGAACSAVKRAETALLAGEGVVRRPADENEEARR